MMRKRGGPGVVSTMARTAVVAGTATKVSNAVTAKDMAKAEAKQEQAAADAAAQQAAIDAAAQAQLASLQAQQADQAALGIGGATLAHLEQLGKLKEAGVLTDEEFAAAKAKVLAG